MALQDDVTDTEAPPQLPEVPGVLGGVALVGLGLVVTTALLAAQLFAWDATAGRPGRQIAFLDLGWTVGALAVAAFTVATGYLALVVATWRRPERFARHAFLILLAGVPLLALHCALLLVVSLRDLGR